MGQTLATCSPLPAVAIVRRAIRNKHLSSTSADVGETVINWSVHAAAALLRQIFTTTGRQDVHVCCDETMNL